ncbi:unnamed protein product [Pipistrellus nathusii]|uniref:Uncharacterized protein n=1 Tax=Pipistrellus nathusii TaxID=59473 RepID=A0ABP0AMM5_PIPNA
MRRLYPGIIEHRGSKSSTSTSISATAAKGNCFHFFLFYLQNPSSSAEYMIDKTFCLVVLCHTFTENAYPSYLCCNVSGSTCYSFHLLLLIIITLVMETLC